MSELARLVNVPVAIKGKTGKSSQLCIETLIQTAPHKPIRSVSAHLAGMVDILDRWWPSGLER